MILTTGSKHGFTVIEAMLAVAVIAFGIVGVLQSYSIAVTAVERAEFNMNAAYLLKAAMGDMEERVLSDGTVKLGQWSGRFGASSCAGVFDDRPEGWSWKRSARKVFVKARPGARAADNPEETYAMTEVDIRVADDGRTPAAAAGVLSYYGS